MWYCFLLSADTETLLLVGMKTASSWGGGVAFFPPTRLCQQLYTTLRDASGF